MWSQFKKYFIIPFGFTLFITTVLIYFSYLRTDWLINSNSLLLLGVFSGFFAFLKWYKSKHFSNLTTNIISISIIVLFLVSLLALALSYFETPYTQTLIFLRILTSVSAFLSGVFVLATKGVKIDLAKNEEAANEAWWHWGILILCALLFLGFGVHHLGQFMTVDEPKWVDVRVPQLYTALSEHKWEDTYINDKPGVLPAFLSGFVNLRLDHEVYKSQPLEYEHYLFFWRLPLLVFNFLLLLPIYIFSRRLLGRDIAILTLTLTALSPILVGVSQIVNPDATLWSTAFLSFLTFFLYLKTNSLKYILYSGLFLGLALTSKYFASIFYIVFFVAIYFEYLFGYIIREQFFTRCLHLISLYAISVLTYTLLFPATWVFPGQIVLGTFGAEILKSGLGLAILGVLVIFFELIVLRGRLLNKMIGIETVRKVVFYCISFAVSAFFSILLINILGGNLFFDYNDFTQNNFVRGSANFLNSLFVSLYNTLLTNTFPVLFGVLLFAIIGINRKLFENVKNQSVVIVTIFAAAAFFLFGSALEGFIADARYQIILYPLLATLASISIIRIFGNIRVVMSVTVPVLILTLLSSTPFYFFYSNSLNVGKYVITEAWGFGGYELAQNLNKLPDAENITIWVDREGTADFFVGKNYWRGATNPFLYDDIDYLVLTLGGERIFRRANRDWDNGKTYLYARVAGEYSILDFYKKEPYFETCTVPNQCIQVTKF